MTAQLILIALACIVFVRVVCMAARCKPSQWTTALSRKITYVAAMSNLVGGAFAVALNCPIGGPLLLCAVALLAVSVKLELPS